MGQKTAETPKYITSIGGQALIEGILMRGPKVIEVAVRTPDGTIDAEPMDFVPLRDRYPILRLPILRGVASFIESLMMGYKALQTSMDKSGMTELEEATEEDSKLDRWLDEHLGDKLGPIVAVIGGVLGVILAVALFFLPADRVL